MTRENAFLYALIVLVLTAIGVSYFLNQQAERRETEAQWRRYWMHPDTVTVTTTNRAAYAGGNQVYYARLTNGESDTLAYTYKTVYGPNRTCTIADTIIVPKSQTFIIIRFIDHEWLSNQKWPY